VTGKPDLLDTLDRAAAMLWKRQRSVIACRARNLPSQPL
jgi:hypothetical protein